MLYLIFKEKNGREMKYVHLKTVAIRSIHLNIKLGNKAAHLMKQATLSNVFGPLFESCERNENSSTK